MTLRRLWLIPIMVMLAACSDAAAPTFEQNIVGDVVGSTAGLHILTQAPTAPALERYQVSFWARRNRASTVLVNYQPAAGESVGQSGQLLEVVHFGVGQVSAQRPADGPIDLAR